MDVFSADWPGICRRIVAAQRRIFDRGRDAARNARVYEGVGEGGDHTLVIDRQCEDEVFAELEKLGAEGASFVAISEERGEVVFGDGGAARVVIDPIDGSLNARRTIPSHSLSIAVAAGDSMADVRFGFVHDFGADDEFIATLGEGADGRTARAARVAAGDGRLEVVGLESAEPDWTIPALQSLSGNAYRLRVVGSIAITAAYVAAGRFDAFLSLRPCRSVDAAAAQLIVREAGGAVAFGDGRARATPRSTSSARYPMAAGRDDGGPRRRPRRPDRLRPPSGASRSRAPESDSRRKAIRCNRAPKSFRNVCSKERMFARLGAARANRPNSRGTSSMAEQHQQQHQQIENPGQTRHDRSEKIGRQNRERDEKSRDQDRRRGEEPGAGDPRDRRRLPGRRRPLGQRHGSARSSSR